MSSPCQWHTFKTAKHNKLNKKLLLHNYIILLRRLMYLLPSVLLIAMVEISSKLNLFLFPFLLPFSLFHKPEGLVEIIFVLFC